ncbi:AUGMIN subunit 8 [Magnolia sinica]|uniref:AUGMIN subunit 8 n=1 Tax=Magnolia sinica TaxID=86752 RepID=UPI002658F795|nr:AUGMIN subunit 8 [Magnolia sinica]XP_058067714.1 AUGMIN subunit 8 [Magnolia sinica]XP_058067715.1 AUGMIN subunit 8 [Magnolia sinica]
MDLCETELVQQKDAADNDIRPPLVPSEKNNAVVAARKPRTREVTSRYKSTVTPTPATPRRCLTPNSARTVSSPIPKRAQSTERRRPTTPSSSPSRPSTPVNDSPMRSMGGRTMEGLWPSTRSLSVSFQADTFSIPVTKRERPVTPISSVHTLRNSANVAHRQAENPAVHRKVTPERKRTPLRGKNTTDQSENSKPVENPHARVIDQHRWPSRTGGKVSANSLTRSIDLTKSASLPIQGHGVSPTRRTPVSDGRGLQKSMSEVTRRVSFDGSRRVEYESGSIRLVDDASLRISGTLKSVSSSPRVSPSSLEAAPFITRPSRTQSLPITGLHHPPPNKATLSPSSSSRGMVSPSRTRPSTPSANSVTSRSSSSTSVLSFIADVRKGKKGASHIEDAHQLRLLYNRYLQWRFVNARADVALSIQKVSAENILYNVWNTTSELRDSVSMKRIDLQQMRQEMKLNTILNGQVTYLDDWASAEREHSSSLSGAIEALEASTLRLPITGGARADIHTVKEAVSSAVDVMQAMGSSICSLLSRVEGVNHLVSELANVAAQERAMLDECGDLLASTAAMQVEESSLRTHLIQRKQAMHKAEQPISAAIQAFV